MEYYSHVGNTSLEFWVDIAQTYLEIRVAQNWQNIIKILEKEGKDSKDRIHFKEGLTKACGNVVPEQVAHAKIGKFPQHSLVETSLAIEPTRVEITYQSWHGQLDRD
jgi:hypothetical protein